MGRENQYLLIGPWTHNNFRSTVGDVNFGDSGAQVRSYDDFLRLELAWFNRWLRDDHSVDLGARAKFFTMGGGDGRRAENERLNHGGYWRSSDTWPPAGVMPVNYYLHEDGVLSRAEPRSEGSSTSYISDPHNTVSSNGRCIVAYGPAAQSGFGGMGPRDQIDLETLPGHGTPGQPIADRPDVIVYQTSPLESDVAITGDITVSLWVSSDAPDTDFYVKLIDQHGPSDDYPSGYGFPVSEGILRARYRNSFSKPELMQTGEVYHLDFPLEPAANLFRAGHRIRVHICGSNFPNFDINRNTGDPRSHESRNARNTVYHDAARPSCLVLPIDSAVLDSG